MDVVLKRARDWLKGFVPTSRTAALLLVAAPVLGASVAEPALLPVGVGWVVAVVALAVVDYWRGWAGQSFTISRQVDRRLSLGEYNPVRLAIANNASAPLHLRIRDDPPRAFRTRGRAITVDVPPQTSGSVSYSVLPQRRGDYEFGDIYTRARSPLGLAFVQRRVGAEAEVEVYPNLMDVRKYDLLLRRARLREVGIRRIRARGEGTEFESLREYVPDDEYRRIDWKATARRAKPISREYEEERSQSVLLALDAGRLMSAEVGGMSKLDYAINAALMLAYVASDRGDYVGAVSFAETVKAFVPPARGRAQLTRILEALRPVRATLCEPDYAGAFRQVALRMRKRSLIVIFTDVVDAQASDLLLGHITALAPHHLPLCVTISDRTVASVAAGHPETAAEAYQKAVAEDLIAQREVALASLRRGGALVLDVPPGGLSVAVVNRYLALKAEGRL